MNIDKRISKNVCVFMPHGRLDAAAAPGLRQRLVMDASLENGIVVDLSDVEFMDSSGLGALVAVARWLNEQKGNIRLACPTDKVRRVLEMTRADRLFDIYDDPDAAAENLNDGTC